LEQTLSVKETLAIITMNREESIPSHLLSRIIVLKVQEPTREEKIGMAQHILLPRLLKSKGFLPETKGKRNPLKFFLF
jgi:ATP-dependent Lon protease